MTALEKLERDISTLRDSIQKTWGELSMEPGADARVAARASIEKLVAELQTLLADRDRSRQI